MDITFVEFDRSEDRDAANRPPLESWPAQKLFERAEALQLPGRTYMTRTELIAALRAA